jgi:hypothetical protein
VRFLEPAAAVGAGAFGAAFTHLAAGIDGDLPGAGGDLPDRGAFAFAQPPADGVDELVAGPGGQRIQAADEPVAGVAPSLVTISRRRKAGGSAATPTCRPLWPACLSSLRRASAGAGPGCPSPGNLGLRDDPGGPCRHSPGDD